MIIVEGMIVMIHSKSISGHYKAQYDMSFCVPLLRLQLQISRQVHNGI